jgi:hypothetical protein
MEEMNYLFFFGGGGGGFSYFGKLKPRFSGFGEFCGFGVGFCCLAILLNVKGLFEKIV